MPPQADNPYIPPESDPRQRGSVRWFVEDDVLWVKDGAELPRLDLSEDTSLLRRRKTFRSKTAWMTFMPIVVLGWAILSGMFLGNRISPGWEFAGAIAMAGLCWLFDRMTCQRATISFLTGERRKRWRKLQQWISGAMTLGSAIWLGFLMCSMSTVERPHHMALVFMCISITWFCISVRRDVHSVKFSDGWFALGGIDPDIIRWLPCDSGSSPNDPIS